MPESYQHKLDRVRPPRVQITYDVETAGSIVMTELPFVVGIMADLGTSDVELAADKRYDPASENGGNPLPAQAAKPLPPFKQRKYVNIDRDNFNDILKSIGPRLSFSVNTQTFEQWTDKTEKDERRQIKFKPAEAKDADGKPTTEKIELELKNIEDFSPINIVKQVKLLRDLLTARNLLSDLLTKLEGNDVLDAKLKQFLAAAPETLDALKAIAKPDAVSMSASAGGDDPAAAAKAAADATAKAAADAAAKAAADAAATEAAAQAAQAAVDAATKAADAAAAKAAAAKAAQAAADATAKGATDATAKAVDEATKAAAADKAAADKKGGK